MNNFIDLATERYSCRSMDANRPVEQEKIEMILEAARLAPTGSNLQRQRILVVNTEEGLAKIRQCTPCHYNAPIVIILSFEKEMKGMEVSEEIARTVGLLDVGIVSAHIALEAKDLGLDTTIAGMFEEEKLRNEFDIPESQIPVLVIPVGYANEKGTPGPLHEKSISVEEMAQWV